MNYRVEKDSMGEMNVPQNAYWSAQTARANLNFRISDWEMPSEFIKAVAIVKMAAASTNNKLGLIDDEKTNAIVKSAFEIINGKHDSEFPIDVFQTGSGTSTNMNVNEVIANRVSEIISGEKGNKAICHPNDDVNKGQSSNDVIPTAIHISAILTLEKNIDKLKMLIDALEKKENEFKHIIKIGRTHLMDAVPLTLGQEFSGYKQQVKNAFARLKEAEKWLLELPLGGTALGTGLNTHPEFAEMAIQEISEFTGISFRQAENLFEGIASKDAIVHFSGSLNSFAVSLMKISNDLRIMSSGPRCGIQEITLPSLQPGSSIMPGKVNPVIPESVIQVSAQVMGMHSTISIAGSSGLLDLNVMMPVITYNLITSIKLLTGAAEHLGEKCIKGITANEERCKELVEWSMAIVTPLAAKIGYDKAAEIAHEAFKSKETVKEVTRRKNILSEEELEDIFNPENMI